MILYYRVFSSATPIAEQIPKTGILIPRMKIDKIEKKWQLLKPNLPRPKKKLNA
jgi:hypothetical protein